MKILIIEDDLHSRKYLENLLQINNYTFFSASNGLEGLSIFEKENPDLVITDIQMPEMNGLDFLESIRNKNTETIVIITTAFGSESYAIQALHLGANNYLKKPVKSIDLLRLIKKYNHIIQSKYNPSVLPGKVIEKKYIIDFDTSYTQIPKIVDKLIYEANIDFPNNERINIELGLVELVTNAIEHGNLEISYNEKQNALDNNVLDDLYAERLANPKFKNRKISVEFNEVNNKIEWTITDEGNGFDWTQIPDPTKSENIPMLNGRGIFISKFLFDKIEYLGKGNIVKITKELRKSNDK